MGQNDRVRRRWEKSKTAASNSKEHQTNRKATEAAKHDTFLRHFLKLSSFWNQYLVSSIILNGTDLLL